jgi:hypothetical protein
MQGYKVFYYNRTASYNNYIIAVSENDDLNPPEGPLQDQGEQRAETHDTFPRNPSLPGILSVVIVSAEGDMLHYSIIPSQFTSPYTC